jgi:PAS domain S-box-containing protein
MERVPSQCQAFFRRLYVGSGVLPHCGEERNRWRMWGINNPPKNLGDGKGVKMRSAMIDRSTNRRLGLKVAKDRRLLQALMDQSSDHIYFKDRNSRFTLVNANMARTFGCIDPSELVGKSDSDFFTEEHGEQAYRDEQDLIQGRIAKVSKEEKETWPDGSETWVHTTKLPLLSRSGKIIGIFGISRDITDQKRMEAAICAGEDTLRLAKDALNIGTWDLDLSGGRASCSPELLRLYGRSGDTMNPEEWLAAVHPDDRESAHSDLQNSFRTDQALNRRFRVIWPDSSVHWLHSISRVIREDKRRVTRVVGIDFDITDVARTEERLQMLSTAVEQSPVSVVITDLEGNIEYANAKAAEVTGYTVQELLGQNPKLLKSGETSPDEYDEMWRTIRGGEWRGIFHNRKKNGELFWEEAAIRPIRDRAGRQSHYLAVKEDITARRATEEALRASEERFRVAAENAGDVVFECDLETGTFEFLGASVRERFPLVTPPASTAAWLKMVFSEDVPRLTSLVDRHFAALEPLRTEYRIVQNDGSLLDVEVHATITRNPISGKLKSIGVLTDITARKSAERAKAELAAIVESSEIAIFSRDMSGRILNWNAGAERVYGYSAEEMVGHSIDMLFPTDRASEDTDIVETVHRGGRVRHLETIRLKKSGEPVPVLLSASPILNPAGGVIGTAYVVWDITPLKLLQQQLAQAQKLESIGQLAAGIAHEINTPIQYIGDNAEFLASAFTDILHMIPRDTASENSSAKASLDYLRAEIPKALDQMQEGVGRVAAIVRAMKRFSHPGPAERLPVDINQAVESTILVSRNEWKYVADLTTDFDPALPLVPCIAGEFNQVVLNLIVNAAHAVSDVVKESGEKGLIKVSTRRSDSFAEIRVSDTGSGIPEAIRSKVFDPFFTTKAVGKGTGQGLSIAHSVIVQKHNGSISFESESGTGTIFIVKLPLCVEPEES